MEENMMNNEVNNEEMDRSLEEACERVPDGPSKGFVALVLGLTAAAGVGAAMAFKKYKAKRSARNAQGKETDDTVDTDFEEVPTTEEEHADNEVNPE